MSQYSFDAVIFDLDGVVTKTALIHAGAWKLVFDQYLRLREKRDGEPFREFMHDADYLPYVDGKPRYDGVESFLESRGIKVPFGVPSDPPHKETVCGIGNKKNLVLRQALKKQEIKIYHSTIRFIENLKKAGVKIGVATSSKNCKLILESAGIEDLFTVRVDGEVSDKLGLKGKPQGDIFVTAARSLGTTPAKSIVVEDAISGVQAGRNGGFGLVLGIARKDNESELIKNGADIAIGDLSEITIDWLENWFHKKPKPLFKLWNEVEPAILSGKRLVLFFDYDGTLTPIVERPELAVMPEDMRDAVKQLSEKHTVAIVSGRMRTEVERLVGIEGLFYAGSHGFDISGPGFSLVQPEAKEAISAISSITKQLSKELGSIRGVLIEEKKFSVAVHYRLAGEKYLPEIKEALENIIRSQSKLCLMSGKKVFEILPDIDWDKGKAIKWIMEALKISWSQASVVYLGDDTTDEYAFRTIRSRGTGILVSEEPKESAADFQLFSTAEVKRLLEKIAAFSEKDKKEK